ncbi:hypothetical protein D3C86_1853170 [compost metagenome]
MTGVHPFRFDFAIKHDGEWRVHERIDRWPSGLVDLTRLQVLWRRIWQPDLQVPLTAWANELGKPLLSAARQPCNAERDEC